MATLAPDRTLVHRLVMGLPPTEMNITTCSGKSQGLTATSMLTASGQSQDRLVVAENPSGEGKVIPSRWHVNAHLWQRYHVLFTGKGLVGASGILDNARV